MCVSEAGDGGRERRALRTRQAAARRAAGAARARVRLLGLLEGDLEDPGAELVAVQCGDGD